MFNVPRTQSVKDHTFITALRQCWTVPSCQTPPLISILSILLDQTKSFHDNFHALVPRLSTSLLPFVLSTCVIPCRSIPNHGHIYAPHDRIILVVCTANLPPLPKASSNSQLFPTLSMSHTQHIHLNLVFSSPSNLFISFTFLVHISLSHCYASKRSENFAGN